MKTPETKSLSVQDVLDARQRLGRTISLTPCTESIGLSELTGSQVFCKHEYLQRTGSFKERGARNALSLLSAADARRGVIAASAGNHALGLTLHGRSLGIPVTVVMPASAPQVKAARCRKLGARVVLHGKTFDEARVHASQLAFEHQLKDIHPFDDPAVIAGQGTVALEILEQVPNCDAVVVPVGGGGLLAGAATVLRALDPRVMIIGAQPTNAACFASALTSGKPVRIATRSTLADGLAVAEAGTRTFSIAAPLVDRVVCVSEEALAQAIWCLAESEAAVVEGAGAAALAVVLSGLLPELVNRRVVVLLSGGNIDPLTHSRVLESVGRRSAHVSNLALAISMQSRTSRGKLFHTQVIESI